MGKQSARLFFQGKDCYDVYFWRNNISKMYLGDKLIWERLAPKFILATESDMYTSEVMNSLSVFNSVPKNIPIPEGAGLDNGTIMGVEYIYGYYYMLLYYRYTLNAVTKENRWLFKSENGYDWKKYMEADRSSFTAKYMGKYQEKLMFITDTGNSNNCISLMGSGQNVQQIFDTRQIQSILGRDWYGYNYSLNRYAVGNDILLVECYNGQTITSGRFRTCVIAIKNGEYAGIIKDTGFSSTDRVIMDNITYDKAGKYFYMQVYVFGSGLYNVFRSKDGIDWTRFCYVDKYIVKILFSNGYVYLSYYDSNRNYSLIRTKDGADIEEHAISTVDSSISGYFCIDDVFYFNYQKEVNKLVMYKAKNIFNVVVDNDGEIKGAEEVHTAENASARLDYACCTNENVKIYI